MDLAPVKAAIIDALKGPIVALKFHNINFKDTNDLSEILEPLRKRHIWPFKQLCFYSCELSFDKEIIPAELQQNLEVLEISSCNLDENHV